MILTGINSLPCNNVDTPAHGRKVSLTRSLMLTNSYLEFPLKDCLTNMLFSIACSTEIKAKALFICFSSTFNILLEEFLQICHWRSQVDVFFESRELLLLAAVFSARFEILQVRLVFLEEQNAAASGNFCEACSDTFSPVQQYDYSELIFCLS